MYSVATDIKGQRFGKLVVLEKMETIKSRAMWLCECDCGNTKVCVGKELRNGKNTTCGCGPIERFRNYNKDHPVERRRMADEHKTHGMSGTRLYKVWTGMKARCHNKNHSAYKNYGGRGIELAEEWNDFQTFYNDMVSEYVKDYTIERIDNNKGYSKDNCKWISRVEQSKNRRNNRYFTNNGETLTLTDLCKAKNLNYHTMVSRLNTGMDIDIAISKPVLEMEYRRW